MERRIIMRIESLPKNSNIKIDEKQDETIIVLPMTNEIFSFLYIPPISLVALFLAWFALKTLWVETSMYDGHYWLYVFILGGVGGIWQLYILFRKKIPEKLVLRANYFFIDTGVPPIYTPKFKEKKDAITRYHYMTRRKHSFQKEELNSLVLKKTKDDSLYLLTFEKREKPLHIGYRLTSEETKWLYAYILNFYNINDKYKVLSLDARKSYFY